MSRRETTQGDVASRSLTRGREGQCRDCAVVWVMSHRAGLCDCTRGLVRRRSRLSLLNKFPVPLPSLVPGPHTETRVPSMSTERSGWRKLVQQRAAADAQSLTKAGGRVLICPSAHRPVALLCQLVTWPFISAGLLASEVVLISLPLSPVEQVSCDADT